MIMKKKNNKIVNIEDFRSKLKLKKNNLYGKQITNTYFDEFVSDVDDICKNIDKNNELFNSIFKDYFNIDPKI